MSLAELMLPLLPGGGAVAFVGAGGKTTALFRLARELEALGRPALVTTTTHLLDPRGEGFNGRLILRADLEGPATEAPVPAPEGGLTVLAARATPEGKIAGLHPSWIPALVKAWGLVLVEADGSRRLPLKAPGPHEPVLPPNPALVVGLIGLDGLGRPMDGATVHRPELFAELTGCAPGAPITWAHLAALVGAPQGLFKGAGGPRVLILNKADLLRPAAAPPAGLAADLVLLCSLEAPDGAIVTLQEGARP